MQSALAVSSPFLSSCLYEPCVHKKSVFPIKPIQSRGNRQAPCTQISRKGSRYLRKRTNPLIPTCKKWRFSALRIRSFSKKKSEAKHFWLTNHCKNKDNILIVSISVLSTKNPTNHFIDYTRILLTFAKNRKIRVSRMQKKKQK